MDSKTELLHEDILSAIRRALDEDIQSGDVTSNSIIPPKATMRGQIIAKQKGTVAGLDVAATCFRFVDEAITFSTHVEEGDSVQDRQGRVGRGHLPVRLGGLLQREVVSDGGEGSDDLVQRVRTLQVVAGQVDGRDLPSADRGRLLEGGEVMQVHTRQPRRCRAGAARRGKAPPRPIPASAAPRLRR